MLHQYQSAVWTAEQQNELKLSQFHLFCPSPRPCRRFLSTSSTRSPEPPQHAYIPAWKRKPMKHFPKRTSKPVPPPPRASKPINDELERIMLMNPDNRKRGDAVTQIVQRISDQSEPKPDTRTLHLVLQLCAQYMPSMKVEEVFHSLHSRHGLSKTPIVYLCLIKAVAREKNLKAILELLADMRASYEKLDAFGFFHIMQLMNKQSLSYDDTTKIFTRIQYLWNPVEPDKFVLEEMMRLCQRTAQPDALASYFQRYLLKIAPQTPPKKICNILLATFQAAGRAKEAAVLLDPLRHANKAKAHPEKYNKYSAS